MQNTFLFFKKIILTFVRVYSIIIIVKSVHVYAGFNYHASFAGRNDFMKKLQKAAIVAGSILKVWERGICFKHTGKMEGMISINTSTIENPFCAKMSLIPGSVCSHCYAREQFKRYPLMVNKYAESTIDLTTRLLSWEEIPVIRSNNETCRLEAFGELNNEIQVINYFQICRRNPDINFALWTKRPDLIDKVIKSGISKPDNINIIWSTLMINGTPDIGKYDFVDGYFTVYTPEYAAEHNIIINCGGRLCNDCLNCYDYHDDIFIINELLK